MFERIISIDWSGAGNEEERVPLRVAVWDNDAGACRIELPPANGIIRSWRRREVREYLRRVLQEQKRTLVGMDFGFGLPWRSDQQVFQTKGWRAMLQQVGQLYAHGGTARSTAQGINELQRFGGHGPYRFNECRTDFRFYLANNVAYYRITELAAPQAISQWYLGSGGTVGFHTISGLSALDWLIGLREQNQLKFAVWPFESVGDDVHVLVETYPAICPQCADYGPCQGDDERDAWKVLQTLVHHNQNGTLDAFFHIPEQHFGRTTDVAFSAQVGFEGWIFGLRNE
ncbi:hypothetical protein E3A20_05200 [Planctomyces bekefii]|uniref:DUF429 domain-containing protein n=1 Tax=Planctomyces bekefii TaxID=1653850 RepID=A0A5C6ME51_9PLAN|nr:hypothetical protein E3A20_05200 [Planctomyces bekefii]